MTDFNYLRIIDGVHMLIESPPHEPELGTHPDIRTVNDSVYTYTLITASDACLAYEAKMVYLKPKVTV